VTRDFRLNSIGDSLWKNANPITPRAHRFEYLFWKLKNRKTLSLEFLTAIEKPNLRCLSCGCKYNFQKSVNCPKCKSDKSFSLDNETLFTDPVAHIVVGLISIIVLAARPWLKSLF
jgi:hypothetical protein